MAAIVLKLDNKIIAARTFPDANLFIPGYVEGLKQDIIEEHEERIHIKKQIPNFEIISFSKPPLLPA